MARGSRVTLPGEERRARDAIERLISRGWVAWTGAWADALEAILPERCSARVDDGTTLHRLFRSPYRFARIGDIVAWAEQARAEGRTTLSAPGFARIELSGRPDAEIESLIILEALDRLGGD